MKNKLLPPTTPYPQGVLAVSTDSVPGMRPELLRLPALSSASPGSHCPARSRDAQRLQARDIAIIDLVFRLRALRADQIAIPLFPLSPNTRCQARLTTLVRANF